MPKTLNVSQLPAWLTKCLKTLVNAQDVFSNQDQHALADNNTLQMDTLAFHALEDLLQM